MKKVQFRQYNDFENKIKNISVLTKNEDQESKTEIHKSFIYKVSLVQEGEIEEILPQVFIKKSLDTRNGVEKFNFRVKGVFFVTHKQKLIKVKFVHTLNILINWKKKIFSPKKSEVLTK